MSIRLFNVVRRRPHIMDILVPKQADIQTYTFQAATNFDGSFTDILSADVGSGYLDPAVDRNKLQMLNNQDAIRIVFDPQTFNGAAGIADDKAFWLQLKTTNISSAVVTSPPYLILPESKLRGDSRVAIAGEAPAGADVSASLQLNLPFRTQDLVIRNQEAGIVLYVALEVGGAEQQVEVDTTNLAQLSHMNGAQDFFLIRAGGLAPGHFSASFTSYLPL
jgi:hypothetical protein